MINLNHYSFNFELRYIIFLKSTFFRARLGLFKISIKKVLIEKGLLR